MRKGFQEDPSIMEEIARYIRVAASDALTILHQKKNARRALRLQASCVTIRYRHRFAEG